MLDSLYLCVYYRLYYAEYKFGLACRKYWLISLVANSAKVIIRLQSRKQTQHKNTLYKTKDEPMSRVLDRHFVHTVSKKDFYMIM